MPKIDPNKYKEIRKQKEQRDFVRSLASSCSAGDPIQLSDLIANKTGWGGSALMYLGTMAQRRGDVAADMTWKIKVLRDEWGNKLGPGDVVVKRTPRPLIDELGASVKPQEMSVAMLDGSYEEKYIIKTKYEVDEKGCIECGFTDAVYFMHNYGLHEKTGRVLSTKEEHSREPVDAPNGQKLHCHYWRFQEVSKKDYEALPEIPSYWKDGKRIPPLRGLASFEEVENFRKDEELRKELEAEKRKQSIIAEAKADNNSGRGSRNR